MRQQDPEAQKGRREADPFTRSPARAAPINQ
jgi:hypothetical protein